MWRICALVFLCQANPGAGEIHVFLFSTALTQLDPPGAMKTCRKRRPNPSTKAINHEGQHRRPASCWLPVGGCVGPVWSVDGLCPWGCLQWIFLALSGIIGDIIEVLYGIIKLYIYIILDYYLSYILSIWYINIYLLYI